MQKTRSGFAILALAALAVAAACRDSANPQAPDESPAAPRGEARRLVR
jgi:hypothetical protein